MKLTQKLVDYLHRVFGKDPDRFLALRLRYDGGMRWSIADGVLTTTVTGGSGAALSVALKDYTVQTLAAFLATRAGYTVDFVEAGELAALSALVMLDADGDQDASNGDHLYGFQSASRALLDAYAVELKAAKDQIPNALAQMTVPTASEGWLDEHGSYYGVERFFDEDDADYAPRIIADVIRPRGNNVAIEMAVSTAAKCNLVHVVDAPMIVQDAGPTYGLFDINGIADAGSSPDFDSFNRAVETTVERMRDAGTHLRNVRLTINVRGALVVAAGTISGEESVVYPYTAEALVASGSLYVAMATQASETCVIYPADFEAPTPAPLFLDGGWPLDGTHTLSGSY